MSKTTGEASSDAPDASPLSWNPAQYDRFHAERSAPFLDLLATFGSHPVPAGGRVVDLGCGTGELTARIADRYPDAFVTGIDSSPSMLERADPRARPGLDFRLGALEDAEGPWDAIFSNAAIQWVDDHPTLVPKIFGRLAPGGRLAIQIPGNHTHWSQTALLEVARREPHATRLGGYAREFPVLSLPDYAELLYAAGGEDLLVFEKLHPHVLRDADAVADWLKGTAMLPYLQRLASDPSAGAAFEEEYRAELRRRAPGSPVFFGFRRIYMAATRPSARGSARPA